MKRVTFSLNYRKPKSAYTKNEELMVCLRYYYKAEGKSKIKKISTGVRCKISDWDVDWHKTSQNQLPLGDHD